MNTTIEDVLKDFNKAINCLAVELPEPVWNDVHFRWVKLQNELKASLQTPPTNQDELWEDVKQIIIGGHLSQFSNHYTNKVLKSKYQLMPLPNKPSI